MSWHTILFLSIVRYTKSRHTRTCTSTHTHTPQHPQSLVPSCVRVISEIKHECVYEVRLPSEMGMEGGKKDGEEEETTTGEEDGDRKKASAVVTVFRFIMKQSYICALIAMMVSKGRMGNEWGDMGGFEG